jgi:coenzyme F420 hydrogenase subunit beta
MTAGWAGRPLRLDEIVKSGLCIGCGLCQSVAGPERVVLVSTAEGRERPVARRPLDDATLRRINDVCPGVRVRGADRHRLATGTPVDGVWGPARRLVIAHAGDPEVRFRASSGGVLTALSEFLLAQGEVEFVVHVAALRARPLRSGRHVSVDRAGLLRAASSRYGPAAPLIDFLQIVARRRPFALVGKPCDISAVRSLARHEPGVDRYMRYALTMVCGGASELTKSTEVLAAFGVEESELTLLRYRGHGNPGATRVETAGGAVHELTYDEMWRDESTWRIQSRCKICPDAIGESADIVAADCWDGGGPQGEDAGFNAVLVRTGAGAALFDAAVAAGRLTLVRDITFRDMDRFQPHQVRKKRAVWARMSGIRATGGRAPSVRGLRIRRLALRTSPRLLLREAVQAGARMRAGRFVEAAPTVGAGETVAPAE